MLDPDDTLEIVARRRADLIAEIERHDDTRAAREHIAALIDANGYLTDDVVRRLGVARSTAYAVAKGDRPLIRRSTADKILSRSPWLPDRLPPRAPAPPAPVEVEVYDGPAPELSPVLEFIDWRTALLDLRDDMSDRTAGKYNEARGRYTARVAELVGRHGPQAVADVLREPVNRIEERVNRNRNRARQAS